MHTHTRNALSKKRFVHTAHTLLSARTLTITQTPLRTDGVHSDYNFRQRAMQRCQRCVCLTVCTAQVDASGKLVGVLSEGDLLWKSAGPLDHTIIPPVSISRSTYMRK